jgi:hypothetical protein
MESLDEGLTMIDNCCQHNYLLLGYVTNKLITHHQQTNKHSYESTNYHQQMNNLLSINYYQQTNCCHQINIYYQ